MIKPRGGSSEKTEDESWVKTIRPLRAFVLEGMCSGIVGRYLRGKARGISISLCPSQVALSLGRLPFFWIGCPLFRYILNPNDLVHSV